MPNTEPSAYDNLAPVRALAVGAAGAHPVAGALLAAIDAVIAQKAGSKGDSTVRAFAESLQKGMGLRTYENLRTLAKELMGAEGYLPPDLALSDDFMRAFAVCTELAATAEDVKKVRYLFNLLMHGVVHPNVFNLARDYDFYARIVTELSMVELHMLCRLAEAEQAAKERIDNINMPYWDDFVSALNDELSLPPGHLGFRLASLSRVSVYTTVSQGVSFGDNSVYEEKGKLTPVGRAFLHYIRRSGWESPSRTDRP